MAYEFQIDELEGPYSDQEGSQIVEFILGFDADTDLIVVMSIILFPTAAADILELCFGIRTKSGAGASGVSEPDYSKTGADLYIPKASRPMVLARTMDAISSVVSSARPDFIAMETFYPNLPVEALEKYTLVCAAVTGCGYVIEDSFRAPENGINYWLFEKR